MSVKSLLDESRSQNVESMVNEMRLMRHLKSKSGGL